MASITTISAVVFALAGMSRKAEGSGRVMRIEVSRTNLFELLSEHWDQRESE